MSQKKINYNKPQLINLTSMHIVQGGSGTCSGGNWANSCNPSGGQASTNGGCTNGYGVTTSVPESSCQTFGTSADLHCRAGTTAKAGACLSDGAANYSEIPPEVRMA